MANGVVIMKSVDHLVKVAERFARKISLAQAQVSAQSGDIANALQAKGLLISSNDVGPLLNTAHVPETATVKIDLMVDSKLDAHFVVTTNPPDKSAGILKTLLERKYGANMKLALIASKLMVVGTVGPVVTITF